jgi:hypothetical protein
MAKAWVPRAVDYRPNYSTFQNFKAKQSKAKQF